jgi:hypothetical protein
LEGLGYGHMSAAVVQYFRYVVAFTQSHYPDMLGQMFVINTPGFFRLVYALVRPWLTDVTAAKIRIMGSDKTAIQDELRAIIPVERLPPRFGGACKCPGGCVPIIDPDEGMTKAVVAKGSTYLHTASWLPARPIVPAAPFCAAVIRAIDDPHDCFG